MSFLEIKCLKICMKDYNMLNILNFLNSGTKRIFFCGVGGASMSALAALTARQGLKCAGSDCAPSKEVEQFLKSEGIELFKEHDAKNAFGYNAFVYTAAISADNPELMYARNNAIPIYTRSQYLGLIAKSFKTTIAVSGTHGKSTVTHMLGDIFSKASTLPTVLAGAQSIENQKAYKIGTQDVLICEACEYNRSFLDIRPDVAVILNVEREHTDTYPTLANAEDAYFEFAKNAKTCITNADCISCKRIGKRLEANGVSVKYFSSKSRVCDAYLRTTPGKGFDIVLKNVTLTDLTLKSIGEHNRINALASALAALETGCAPDHVKKALCDFKGLKRRFEYIGNVSGADVFDDYAHHPTEIKATVKAALELGYDHTVCVFQPHTYSRTSAFFDDFTKAFTGCDEVIFADIYAAREKNAYGVTSKALASKTPNGVYAESFEEILKRLVNLAKKGTLILTMGAGRMNEIAYALVENGVKGKD